MTHGILCRVTIAALARSLSSVVWIMGNTARREEWYYVVLTLDISYSYSQNFLHNLMDMGSLLGTMLGTIPN